MRHVAIIVNIFSSMMADRPYCGDFDLRENYIKAASHRNADPEG